MIKKANFAPIQAKELQYVAKITFSSSGRRGRGGRLIWVFNAAIALHGSTRRRSPPYLTVRPLSRRHGTIDHLNFSRPCARVEQPVSPASFRRGRSSCSIQEYHAHSPTNGW